MAQAELPRVPMLAAAVVVATIPLLLEAHAAAHGRLSASHPWGAAALVAGAVNIALHAMRPEHVPADAPRYLAAGAVLGTAVIALIASLGLPP